MKLTHRQLLKLMIDDYASRRKAETGDMRFDAYDELATALNHKSTSTLRKWTGPESSSANAKMGYEDSMVLQIAMNDFRLIEYSREWMIERRKEKQQLNLFSEPLRNL